VRILLVNNVFPPGFIGGYELGALDVVRRLRRAGHEITVLTSDYFLDERNEIDGFEVVRTLECVAVARDPVPTATVLARGPFLNGDNVRRMHEAMRAVRPDAVMLFNLEGLGALGLVQFAVGAGYVPVLYLMDDVFRRAREGRTRWDTFLSVCGRPDWLSAVRPIAMSVRLRDEIRGTVGPDLPDGPIVPGWHGPVADQAEVFGAARERRGRRFVFASQLAEHKGVGIVMNAAALARERGADGFEVDLYGAGDVDAVGRRIAALGVEGIVRYRGTCSKDELCRRFAEYDALLLPTWEREPFGFVVPEAAANGCVPLMTAQIGAAEWFLDDVDCFKLRRDAASFAGGLLKFLALSRHARAALRENARRTALTHLGLDRWIGVIEQVTTEAAAAGGGWNPDRAARAEAAARILDDLWRNAVDDAHGH